jgi:DNA replication and repair protein RecF
VLIQSGSPAAQVAGRAASPAGGVPLGVEIAAGGLDIHVGGRGGATAADLAAALPVQAIHAEIGELVQGSPEFRRRVLDWGVFHVEHHYLVQWRLFRRALNQRNAVLRDHGPDSLLEAWDGEMAAAGEAVHGLRVAYLETLRGRFQTMGAALVGADIGLRYQRGWPEDQVLLTALRESRGRDRSAGYTRFGPQRADLQFEMNHEGSRWRASKGQQKLLGSALVLAQCALVTEQAGHAVALLVDEPAADLDRSHLNALMRAILSSPAQVFLASIAPEGLPFDVPAVMFHVEHGHAKALL